MELSKVVNALNRIVEKLAYLVVAIGGDQKDYNCDVYCATNQVIGVGPTRVAFDTKVSDPENCFTTATNRWTCPISGWYCFDIALLYNAPALAGKYEFFLKKNGANYKYAVDTLDAATAGLHVNPHLSCTVYCEKGDYFEVEAFSPAVGKALVGGSSYSFFSVGKLNKYSSGSSLPNGEAWITVTVFQNSWVNYGSGYTDAQYFKDQFGVVHLRGLVKSGTVGTVPIFTLPVGYRPGKHHLIPACSNSSYGQVNIETNGEVWAQVGSNIWFSLDGVSFRADGY